MHSCFPDPTWRAYDFLDSLVGWVGGMPQATSPSPFCNRNAFAPQHASHGTDYYVGTCDVILSYIPIVSYIVSCHLDLLWHPHP